MRFLSRGFAGKKTVIFPHIPKCGGSSLRAQFEASSLKVFFDYDNPPHNKSYFQQNCDRRNSEYNRLDFRPFDLVFGHFPIKRYNKKYYQYITIMRHPVDRAISHYFFWKNLLDIKSKQSIVWHPIILDIKNGNVDFIDFLVHQQINIFYRKYLGDKQPDDFVLVGFTDRYENFVRRLSSIINTSIQHNVHLRRGVKDHIPRTQQQKALDLLSDEIKLYNTFRKVWL